jgi:hypothetical protein
LVEPETSDKSAQIAWNIAATARKLSNPSSKTDGRELTAPNFRTSVKSPPLRSFFKDKTLLAENKGLLLEPISLAGHKCWHTR